MFATLNGSGVLSAVIRRPRVGAWTADVRTDIATAITGSATLVVGQKVTFVGTVVRGAVYLDAAFVRIAGGAAGLTKQIPSRFYRGVSARVVLSDALSSVGERLSPTVDSGLLSRRFGAWTRAAGSAGSELTRVADALGVTWRVLEDGTVWLGSESWPALSLTYDVMNADEVLGRMEIATDLPLARPGTTLSGRRIAHVEHWIEPKKARDVLIFDRAA